MANGTVGELRQNSALCGADERVEIVTEDPRLWKLVDRLVVVRFYPDTVDRDGRPRSTLKIEVRT